MPGSIGTNSIGTYSLSVYTQKTQTSNRSKQSSATSASRQPPINLDAYVDWATDRACNHRIGLYQMKVLAVLPMTWFLTAIHTYSFRFITVEPDINELSGRLLDLENCTAKDIAIFGQACPELNKSTCGPKGATKTPEFREMWRYRDQENSATAEFDLSFCSDHPHVLTQIRTLFWISYGLGVLVGGVMSDRMGRRFSFYTCLTIMTAGAFIMMISTGSLELGVGRSLNGFGIGGVGLVAYVWASESLNVESQHFLTWAFSLAFVTGACFPALFTLWFPRWRGLALATAVSSFPLFFLPALVLDSPKWLAAQKDRARVWEVMRAIVATNRQPALLPPPDTKAPYLDSLISDPVLEGWWVFYDRRVKIRLTVSSLLWCSGAYSYYALTMFGPAELFKERPVLSWCFNFAFEVPARIVAGCLIQKPRFGRRIVCCGGIGAGALLLLLGTIRAFTSREWTWILDALYFPARLLISAGFAVIYMWSAELYPTSIRNQAVGVNSFWARMGAMFLPWVDYVESVNLRIALIAMPTLVVAALAFRVLPETQGKPLPGEVDDL